MYANLFKIRGNQTKVEIELGHTTSIMINLDFINLRHL